MSIVACVAGVVLILIVLWDAFETIILPRRVTRRIRLTKIVYRGIWRPWRAVARRMRQTRQREGFLSVFGPLVLLGLLATWAGLLILGFALVQWGLGSPLSVPYGHVDFGTDLYMSGTTFITLGLGDVAPHTAVSRALTVIEAGTGFGFLALMVSYLPVLFGAFSRREVNISLLDARAGSPPSGVELLRRAGASKCMVELAAFLLEWEHWGGELLESHLSYPMITYFRSQHTNQSWVAALTAIMDCCSLILVGVDGMPSAQARLTFAVARHATVDLCQVLDVTPIVPERDRLPPEDLEVVRTLLARAGIPLIERPGLATDLTALRALYEPFVCGLSKRLLFPLPDFLPHSDARDNWESSAWDQVHRDLSLLFLK
jgi:hypothetical protein